MLILTTAHREALLPTILSRCQNVRFDPLTEDEIAAALTGRRAPPRNRPRWPPGSRTAATRGRSSSCRTTSCKCARMWWISSERLLEKTLWSSTDAIESIVETKDRDVAVRFLTLMLIWFRDALVLSHGGQVINLDQETELKNFLARFPGR